MSSPRALEKVLSEDLKSGLQVTVVDEAGDPYVRVDWIRWDSGFRAGDLAIGDRIVALNGAPITLPDDPAPRRIARDRLIGGLTESTTFAELGLQEGSIVTLTVRRRTMPGRGWATQDVTGALRAERIYYTADTKRALAPGGPDPLSRNEAGETWQGWFDRRVFEWSSFLDGERVNSLDSRRALAAHLELRPTIDAALRDHPGPFTERLAEDWDRVAEVLRGRAVQLPPDALEFREAGEAVKEEVAAAGDAAWSAFLDAHAAVEELPEVDLVRDDRRPIVGQVIALVGVTWTDSVKDGDRTILTTSHSDYPCSVIVEQPAMQAFWQHKADYQARLEPQLPETYDIVGRVGAGTRLVVTPRRGAEIGLDIEVLAVRVPGHFFVDLTGRGSFTGADRVATHRAGLPPDDASPTEVMRAYVDAVKSGDEKTWLALHADWVAIGGEGRPLYRPFDRYNNHTADFTRARELILHDVVHVEPVWEDDLTVVMRGDEFDGAPKVDQVDVFVDHVGEFDGGHYVFSSIEVSRLWQLQRRNGGPWRITSRNVL